MCVTIYSDIQYLYVAFVISRPVCCAYVGYVVGIVAWFGEWPYC